MKKDLKFSSIIFAVCCFLFLVITFTPIMARTVKILKDAKQDIFNIVGKLVVDGDAEIKGDLNVKGSITFNEVHGFGGAYMKYSGCDSIEEEGTCKKNNPITNACTCPAGYSAFFSAHSDSKGDGGCTNLVICVK
mgnify:CR=1 FL=1